MEASLIEWLGYAASALIVASLAMTSIIRLRIVSLIGSALFGLYGVFISAPPVVITNGAIVAINLWFLIRVLSTEDRLSVVPAQRDDPIVSEFIAQHRQDIEQHAQPTDLIDGADVCFLMLRNDTVAGVFLGVRTSPDDGLLVTDYVTAPFRDLKNGKSLYAADGRVFRELGIRRLRTSSSSHPQVRYLSTIGFVEADGCLERSFGDSGG